MLRRFLCCARRRIWTLRRLEPITISAMPFGKLGNGVQRQPNSRQPINWSQAILTPSTFRLGSLIPKGTWTAPSSYTRPQSHPATRFLTRINDWGKHTHAKESLRKLWTSRDWRFSKRLGMERFTINSGRFTAKWDARRKLSRSLNQASERSVLIRCRSKSYWSSLGQSGRKRSIERLSCAENC